MDHGIFMEYDSSSLGTNVNFDDGNRFFFFFFPSGEYVGISIGKTFQLEYTLTLSIVQMHTIYLPTSLDHSRPESTVAATI